MARQVSERAAVIASEDATVTDARGLRFRIVAGTEVPRGLLDAYQEQVGTKRAGRKLATADKAQRAPAMDKAQRAPETDK